MGYLQTPAVLSMLVGVLLLQQMLEMYKEKQFASQCGRLQSIVSYPCCSGACSEVLYHGRGETLGRDSKGLKGRGRGQGSM